MHSPAFIAYSERCLNEKPENRTFLSTFVKADRKLSSSHTGIDLVSSTIIEIEGFFLEYSKLPSRLEQKKNLLAYLTTILVLR